MQLNHLPAVKTRCCSVMPLFSFVGFNFSSFYFINIIIVTTIIIIIIIEFHSFKQTLEIHWKCPNCNLVLF